MPANGPEPPPPRRRRHGLRVWLLRPTYRVAYRLLQIYTLFGPRRSRGVKCVLTHRGQVVLVRHTYGPRREWQIPGGGARRGESLRATADREMLEELGVQGLQWRELPSVTVRLSRRRVRIPCLTAELEDSEMAPDAAEIAEVGLFDPRQLPAPLAGEVRGLVRAALPAVAT